MKRAKGLEGTVGRGYKAPDHIITLEGKLSPQDTLSSLAVDSISVGSGFDASTFPISEARHLPGYIYWHPEVFRREKEQMFMVDWLMVAREEEVEEPGDYITMRLLDEPIVITRDEEGEIQAFHNRCAHRGVAVASGQGNTREFSCPYHGWLYDLKGQLLAAPHMKTAKGFKIDDCRLRPIAVARWAGWIFINFSSTPKSFDDFISEFDADFAFLRQERCRLAETLCITLECNWKFVVENLMDNYHTTVLHKATIGRNISKSNRFSSGENSAGSLTAFYDAKPMTWDQESRFGPMPWIAERGLDFACSGHLAPNTHLFARCDNVHPFIIWPITPTKTMVLCFQLFPDEHFSDPDFAAKVKDYTVYTQALVEEDSAMTDSLQDAAMSPYFTPGYMSDREQGVHNVINYNLKQTFPETSSK